MATFTNATVLGINASSEFLGDGTVRLRTVKAIDVEGFIDSRSNSDVEGVSQTQSTIDSLVGSLNTATTETEEIIINGYNFGTGKIISADFPSAAGGATDNQILIGKWNASVEVYESGDSTLIANALDSLSISNTNFLQDFSESFSASRSDDNTYEFSHDVSLKYMSGLQPYTGAPYTEVINPISGAKTLAQSIFSQTLSSFNLALGIDTSYDYNSIAQNFFNETYDLENGTANYQKRFSLFNTPNAAAETNYSAQITTAFEMGDDGIAKVSERGEVKGRDALPKNVMTKSLEGYVSLMNSSYTRCNAVYNTYKSYLGTPTSLPYLKTNASSLVNSIISQSKSVDANAGTVSYDVSYTDNNNIKNVDSVEEKTIDFSTDANITTVSEKGTITVRNSKFSENPSAIISKLPTAASVKTRCTDVYSKNGKTGTLRLLKNSASYAGASFISSSAKGGKSLEYSYEFTDDPEVVASPAAFTKKQIKSADSIGVVNTKAIMFPNQPGNQVYIQYPGQTSVSTRTVSADAQMTRALTNNFIAFRNFRSASREIFQDMLLEGFKFFQDNPSFTTIDKSQVFVSDISFNFNHENKLGASLSLTIIGSRNPADMRKIL